ncbi:MAG: restriction endonuclease subunit S [Methylococcaceae bacterium]
MILFNHDGLTQDGIAEAFIEFAKKERLSFFDLGLSGSKNLAGLYAEAFDEGKYRVLLERLEVTIIDKSAITNGAETLRYDSEYYLKQCIKTEQLIKRKSDKFSKFSELNLLVDASAFYPALEPFYNTGNYPFIRVGDIKNHVDFENCIKVPFEILHGYPTLKHVKKGDIVLTKGGTIGLAGLITQDCCVTRDLIFINSSDLNEQDYITLFLFLSTKFVYQQLIRSGSQSVQPHLTVTLVRNIDVYHYSDFFKDVVTKIYKQSIFKLDQSKSTYAQAENLLLNALGMANFSPSTENVNIKSFKNSFFTSGRLDAEPYQIKYEQVEEKIKAYPNGFATLGEISPNPTNGVEIREYCETGTPYLRIGDIKQLQINEKSLVSVNPEAADLLMSKVKLKEGDVLMSRSGSLGVICVVEKQWVHSLISSHLIILRIEDRAINSYFLALFLSSMAGKLQIEKNSNGGVQPEINHPALKSILVPKLDMETQTEIAVLVQQSFALKAKSERLLATAKRAVETAIETDEQTAMAFIGVQT